MNDEPKNNAEPNELTPGRVVWLSISIIFSPVFIFYIYPLKSYFERHGATLITGIIWIALIGSVFLTGYCAYQLFASPSPRSNYWKIGKGITLFSLIGCITLAFVLPMCMTYKEHTPGSQTKADLHNMYLACKAYWADNGGDKNCDAEQYNRTTYGYIQTSHVSVSGSGTESAFTAKAYNTKETKTFVMDHWGAISEVDGK